MVGMLSTVPDLFDTAWRQHRQIAEALAAGDADLAERLAREHIRDSALKFTDSIGDE